MWPDRRLRPSLSLSPEGMDFTPLMDVVFQLMIFFMLTSSFVFQTGVEVHLPKAVTSEVSQGMNWQVTVSKEGRLYLETRVVTLQELKRTLNRHRERPVLLRADQRATLGRVIEVWDLCRSLGISQIHIATQDEP